MVAAGSARLAAPLLGAQGPVTEGLGCQSEHRGLKLAPAIEAGQHALPVREGSEEVASCPPLAAKSVVGQAPCHHVRSA